MIKRFTAIAQSPAGRLLLVLVGVGIVSAMVWSSGPQAVLAAVTRVPIMFVLVLLLELAIAGTEAWAGVLVYGPDRKKIPMSVVVRTSLFCYALIGVMPFGRPAGEAARAALYGKYVGYPLAAASATRAQAITLLGNAAIAVPCVLGAWLLTGPSLLLGGVAVILLLNLGLGGGIILAGRHWNMAARIGKYFRGGQSWGPKVDEHLASDLSLFGPMFWVSLSRVCSVLQRAVLLAAVGVSPTVLHSLASQSINLVASAVGDAIPAGVGVTEFGYGLASQLLGMTASDGVAMALLVHVAQVICVGLGFLAPVLMAPAPPVPSPNPE